MILLLSLFSCTFQEEKNLVVDMLGGFFQKLILQDFSFLSLLVCSSVEIYLLIWNKERERERERERKQERKLQIKIVKFLESFCLFVWRGGKIIIILMKICKKKNPLEIQYSLRQHKQILIEKFSSKKMDQTKCKKRRRKNKNTIIVVVVVVGDGFANQRSKIIDAL